MHMLVSQCAEQQKRPTEAELKVPEKMWKTPGATYLGYRAIYSDSYDVSKCG